MDRNGRTAQPTTPQPLRDEQQGVFDALLLALLGRKRFLVLVGGPGTDRSRIFARLVEHVESDGALVMPVNARPGMAVEDLVTQAGAAAVGSEPDDFDALLEELESRLDLAGSGLLAIDNAHLLGPAVLADLAELTRSETPEGRFVQVLLSGAPDIARTLDRPALASVLHELGALFTLTPAAPTPAAPIQAAPAPPPEAPFREAAAPADTAGQTVAPGGDIDIPPGWMTPRPPSAATGRPVWGAAWAAGAVLVVSLGAAGAVLLSDESLDGLSDGAATAWERSTAAVAHGWEQGRDGAGQLVQRVAGYADQVWDDVGHVADAVTVPTRQGGESEALSLATPETRKPEAQKVESPRITLAMPPVGADTPVEPPLPATPPLPAMKEPPAPAPKPAPKPAPLQRTAEPATATPATPDTATAPHGGEPALTRAFSTPPATVPTPTPAPQPEPAPAAVAPPPPGPAPAALPEAAPVPTRPAAETDIAAVPPPEAEQPVAAPEPPSNPVVNPASPTARVVAVTTAPDPAALQRVRALADQARRQIVNKRLTTPAGDNAYETVQRMRELAPDAPEAAQLVADMVETYRRWAALAERQGDWGEARVFYERALIVNPDDAELQARLRDTDQRLRQADGPGSTSIGFATTTALLPLIQKPDQLESALAAGADPNQRLEGGKTPLMLAAEQGQTAAVRRLLDAGGRADLRSSDGATALMYAAWNGHADVVGMLADAGADINAANDDGKTALMAAAARGQGGAVEALLKRGATVDRATAQGWTALMYAVSAGQARVARLLAEYGADPNRTNAEGRSAVALGQQHGHVELVQALTRH